MAFRDTPETSTDQAKPLCPETFESPPPPPLSVTDADLLAADKSVTDARKVQWLRMVMQMLANDFCWTAYSDLTAGFQLYQNYRQFTKRWKQGCRAKMAEDAIYSVLLASAAHYLVRMVVNTRNHFRGDSGSILQIEDVIQKHLGNSVWKRINSASGVIQGKW